MMKYISYIYCSVVLVCMSCKHDKVEKTCESPDTVSFSQDIQPMFNEHCISCHGGSSPAGNLNLESSVSYTNLMNPQSGYVDTINPLYSVLYGSMNSTSNPMPPNGKLEKCKIELVLKWIQQKAKNN